MCGVIGYFGKNPDVESLVIDGLKRLEYRGYDSWGMAVKQGNEILIQKKVGKIGDVRSDLLKRSDLRKHRSLKGSFSMALGHSRWATHGNVTDKNAHPHATENKEVVVVHNGIFENYLELKTSLSHHRFTSETDTEVFAHLVEERMKKLNFESAVKQALKEIEGRYAVLVISKRENKMIAARRGSPLILGIGKNEYFIASDIPAFLPYTRIVQYLDDNDLVVIDEKGSRFENMETGQKIEKRLVKISTQEEDAKKGDFPHFMIKEIMEQKESLMRAINQDEDLLMRVAGEINRAFGTYLVGCGTAGKVCMTAEYIFSKVAKKHINVAFGSEFPPHQHFLSPKSLLIAVSQSGETMDTVEAIEVAKKIGCKVISIVNVETSSIARASDIVLPIKAGPEKAVASTKATTSQLAILTLLAYACIGKLKEGKELLLHAAAQLNDLLNPRYEEHIKKLAKKIYQNESVYIIGRSMNFPMALEAAIKLQEVSYIHAEGFAGGELKHGPIALISKGTPVIALVANDENRRNMISNAEEVKARGGFIIGVSPQNEGVFDYWLRVPDVSLASPIVNIIPIQLLAYHLAVLRKNDPDKPRNLAKSVTVK